MTPSRPYVIVAACSPTASPRPSGSTPIRSTGSSRNAEKMPIALEPPPTQAPTTSGRLPVISTNCSRASMPTTFWKSRTMSGNGCGSTTEPMQQIESS